MSGVGKSQGLKALEDVGFFCVDNLPPALIGKFSELLIGARVETRKFAVVVDVRSRGNFDELFGAVEQLKTCGVSVRIVFLDASDSALMHRYKETRRRHPLMDEGIGTVAEAIQTERSLLAKAKERADYTIDTTMLSASQLREMVSRLLGGDQSGTIAINCTSFGYKFGLPEDADLVFDVRVLPNPFYIESMRIQTGLDQQVSQYVLGFSQTRELIERILDFVLYMLPHFQKEGKSYLVIGIGCTGGRHRSVTVAEELARLLEERGLRAVTHHRDCQK
jgi:UPF0042 nucleotide-binding protein